MKTAVYKNLQAFFFCGRNNLEMLAPSYVGVDSFILHSLEMQSKEIWCKFTVKNFNVYIDWKHDQQPSCFRIRYN